MTAIEALQNGAALVISISGGKDSDAMLLHLLEQRTVNNWTGEVVAVHADLGEMEHPESLPHCQRMCEKLGVELVVLHKDLLKQMDERREKLDSTDRADTPHWPSSAARYCTSDNKRAPINKWVRNRWVHDAEVVIAMGLRAEESSARAKRACDRIRPGVQAVTKNRVVHEWLPIHDWTEEQVWQQIGYEMADLRWLQDRYRRAWNAGDTYTIRALETRFKAHVAYLRGNERVSCVFCIMGSQNDWDVGAAHHPDHFQALVYRELVTGFSYIAGRWLADTRPELLNEVQKARLVELKAA